MSAVVYVVGLPSQDRPGFAGEAARRLAACIAESPGTTAVAVSDPGELWQTSAALDALALPFRAHGSALFAAHPHVRRWLLACTALAQGEDAAAEAALYGPPLFPLDPEDLVVSSILKDSASDPRRARVVEARGLVEAWARERHRVPPHVTARRLLEESHFLPTVERLPNGEQDLGLALDLLDWIERTAWEENLDFDLWAARCRATLGDPAGIGLATDLSADVVHMLPLDLRADAAFQHVLLWPPLADAAGLDRWLLRRGADRTLDVSSSPLHLVAVERVTLFCPAGDTSLREEIRARL